MSEVKTVLREPGGYTILGDSIKVLDHGYVQYIDHYGSDEAIIEAARMSTAKGFLGWGGDPHKPTCHLLTYGIGPGVCNCGYKAEGQGDEKLLRHLWVNKHATPFEMAGAIIEIQLPIFAIREWHRHRTQSYAEMSARYTPLPDVNYIPTLERLMMAPSATNKQASVVKGAQALSVIAAKGFQEELAKVYADQEALYQSALAAGVPKELARVHLPVGRYSRMRAHANLRNWLGFLTLRMDSAAQWEIRQYANTVHTILSRIFPRTLALFDEGRTTA